MPRPRKSVPSYRLHKQSGQGIVTLPLAGGKLRDVLLGPYGSPESRAEYARIVAEFQTPAGAAGHVGARLPDPHPDLTVAELLVAFLGHVEQHYRQPDGTPTSEVYNFKLSLRAVRELYAHTPAREFGPRALKAVRQVMVDKGWCRKQINVRVGRIRRMFKWAVSEELLPVAVYTALATVTGLQAGRSKATERPPVKPVPAADVDAALPFLGRHARGLVEFQRLTGCRPGEACRLRRCDVDTAGEVWVYTPARHKTAWRGKTRAIPIGPRARQLLEQFPTADPAEYIFSPRRAVAEHHAARAVARKTPRYPSHMRHNARRRVGEPGANRAERYSLDSYEQAVDRAIDRANREREAERVDRGPNRPPVPHWKPNQLRHLFGTDVRGRFGLEAAQVLLGHERADVTQLYAERNHTLALRVAAEIG